MAEVGDQTAGSGSWKLNFLRAFNDWEWDLVVNLLSTLQQQRVTSELDGISWKGMGGDGFSVHGAYKVHLRTITVILLCSLLRAFGCLAPLLNQSFMLGKQLRGRS